jgi:L-amino acid N-acyltransferase YncA
MIFRDARPEDAESILAIYSPVVRDSAISFELVPPTVHEMKLRIEQSTWRWPWLVATQDEMTVGYAYARSFRSRIAYQFTAETTVYVHPDVQRQGVGRLLMQYLLNRLYSAGHHVAVAGIALPNAGSVALHERLWFQPIGVFPAVGRKFQSWHEVGFWSHMLSDQTVEIPNSDSEQWRMRIVPPTSLEAQLLTRQISQETTRRYNQQGDGSDDFIPVLAGDSRSAFVVGWLNNAPAACGAICPLEDDVAELKGMFVVPEHRGKELSSQMSSQILMRLELEAERLDYKSIRLETGNCQPEASTV